MPLSPHFQLLLACAMALVVHDDALAAPPLSSAKLVVSPVATVVSREAENEQAFLLRAAPVLRDFTASTGFESCAQLCRNDRRIGLAVYTSGSHIGCMVVNICPRGMMETGETMHSHSSKKSFTPNTADRIFAPFRKQRAPKLEVPSPGEVAIFSRADYKAGPGYVVDGGVLWYQQGAGTDQKIGRLK